MHVAKIIVSMPISIIMFLVQQPKGNFSPNLALLDKTADYLSLGWLLDPGGCGAVTLGEFEITNIVFLTLSACAEGYCSQNVCPCVCVTSRILETASF